jgi:flagellar basal body rod protein FlgG
LRFDLKSFLVGVAVFALSMAVVTRLAQPTIVRTDNPLDLVIVGNGFFELTNVQTGESAFTRCGAFEIDQYGDLSLKGTEYSLEPHITIPGQVEVAQIMVDTDGEVTCRFHGELDPINIGQICVCAFVRKYNPRVVF